MKKILSKDGTSLAFDQFGTGPAIILVGGAFQHRAIDSGTAKLAALLAPHFTVLHYDRRGRGDSEDTLPYAIEREIEDIDALLQEVGGFGLCLRHVFRRGSGPACRCSWPCDQETGTVRGPIHL